MRIPIYKGDSIVTLGQLAAILDTSLEDLHSLSTDSNKFYHPNRPEPKSDGGTRQTYSVEPVLQTLQEKLLQRVFYRVDYPYYLQGSIKDPLNPRDYITDAQMHIGAYVILTVDIKSFFPSMKSALVLKMWQELFACPAHVAQVLTQLTTYKGFVAQGAPTSSYIGTLLFWDLEPCLEKHFRENGCTYSRLVDDITISSKKRLSEAFIQESVTKVCGMLQIKRLKPKYRKLFVRTRHNARPGKGFTIHGLNIGMTKVTMTSQARSKVRAAVRACEHMAAFDRYSMEYEKLYISTMGRVINLSRLHPAEGAKYRATLQAICPFDVSIDHPLGVDHEMIS